MRRLAALLCLLLLLAGAACAETAPQVLYFYENICESCTPEEDFLLEYEGLTGISLSPAQLQGHNVFHESGKQALTQAVESLGLSLDAAKLPMAVVDGVAYMGSSALHSQLPADALAMAPEGSDSVLYYLYMPACESCARAVAVLDALPETVSVRRGSLAIDSRVVIRRVDVSADPQLSLALFSQYGVPDAERITPIVLFGTRYLSGADAIERSLDVQVRAGRAIGTPVPVAAAQEVSPSAWTFGGAALAGVVGGLNPCALSMLLLFLSTLLQDNPRAGRYAAAFLASKFVCYVLIGVALLGLLQQLNPTWLLPLTRWILTIAGCLLAAINLWDAWQARQGALGKVRNQLPGGMRRRLHTAIARVRSAKPSRLLPLVCLLAFAVAAGEFLCAGQLYLAGLLAALQSGANFARMLPLLLAYCLAFLAPSALLAAFVLRAKRAMAASGFLARHMALIKLLTAVVMLLLVAAAWLL